MNSIQYHYFCPFDCYNIVPIFLHLCILFVVKNRKSEENNDNESVFKHKYT